MDVFGYQRSYMDYVEKLQNRKLVLFGAGGGAFTVIANYYGLDDVAFICDNDSSKWGTAIFNIPVLSPEKILEAPDSYVILITPVAEFAVHDISMQLLKMGAPHVFHSSILRFVNHNFRYSPSFNKHFHELNAYQTIEANSDRIRAVRDMLSDEKSMKVYDSLVEKRKYNIRDYTDICDNLYDIYYSDGIFRTEDRNEGEVLVDAGSFDGLDTIRFAEIMGVAFRKSYCFEPDTASYARTRKNLERFWSIEASSSSEDACGCDLFTIYRTGLHNTSARMNFASYGTHASRYLEGSGNDAPVVKLDDMADILKSVTFIKMDIEGSEMAALEGAQQTIRARCPKLAISIYHQVDDLWQIPYYIKSLVPAYRLFIRHHHYSEFSSIVYAAI